MDAGFGAGFGLVFEELEVVPIRVFVGGDSGAPGFGSAPADAFDAGGIEPRFVGFESVDREIQQVAVRFGGGSACFAVAVDAENDPGGVERMGSEVAILGDANDVPVEREEPLGLFAGDVDEEGCDVHERNSGMGSPANRGAARKESHTGADSIVSGSVAQGSTLVTAFRQEGWEKRWDYRSAGGGR